MVQEDQTPQYEWDVFISHAGEDKDEFVNEKKLLHDIIPESFTTNSRKRRRDDDTFV